MRLQPSPANPLRALPFVRPSGPARPRPFEVAAERIEAGLARLHSADHALWKKLAEDTPVYGPGGQLLERQRRLRCDGARNLATLIQVLIFAADPKGFLGWPNEGAWKRPHVRILDVRAYGKVVPEARSCRRTERWLRVMVELGFLTSGQITKEVQPGVFRGAPAARRLTKAFWQILGVYHQLRQLQRDRERETGRARAEQLGQQLTPKNPRFVVRTGGAGKNVAPPPQPPEKPPDRDTQGKPAHIAAIFANLKDVLK